MASAKQLFDENKQISLLLSWYSFVWVWNLISHTLFCLHAHRPSVTHPWHMKQIDVVTALYAVWIQWGVISWKRREGSRENPPTRIGFGLPQVHLNTTVSYACMYTGSVIDCYSHPFWDPFLAGLDCKKWGKAYTSCKAVASSWLVYLILA